MSAHVLITGNLFRAPEQKSSKAGKSYVVATIRSKESETSQFWHLTVFSESAQAEIMRLADGDAVSAQGPMKAEVYDGGSGPKLSLSLIADQVLALRQPAKTRDKLDAPPPPPDPRPRARSFAGLDDDMPF